MQWPWRQFAAKSHHLKILKIGWLGTKEENRNLIMDFSAEVATTSCCLDTLYFYKTESSAFVGEKFWGTLANDENLVTLTDI